MVLLRIVVQVAQMVYRTPIRRRAKQR